MHGQIHWWTPQGMVQFRVIPWSQQAYDQVEHSIKTKTYAAHGSSIGCLLRVPFSVWLERKLKGKPPFWGSPYFGAPICGLKGGHVQSTAVWPNALKPICGQDKRSSPFFASSFPENKPPKTARGVGLR